MKTITICCTWRSTHEVEVPDEWDGFTDDIPEEAIGGTDPHTAELIDWELA